MDKVSLYIQLAEDIKTYIANHALAAGDRIPSIQELCARFNVSHATVRSALNLLVNEGVVESRPRQGMFVSSAKAPKVGLQNDKVIGLLLSGKESPYEAGLIRGVMEQSRNSGYQVIVASNNSDVAIEAQQLEELAGQVSGMVVFPTHSSGNYASYGKLLEQGIPWVFIDRGVSGLAASLVATDNEYGGYLGARYLLEQGFKRIYAISAKPVTSIQERIQGFRRALKEWGLPYEPGNVRSSPLYVSAEGYKLTQGILNEQEGDEPIAIFVLDETLALPCYAALKEAKKRIPEDVAVLSYDDMNAKFFDPPLSSIRQNPHRMGLEATQILIDLVQGKKNTTAEVRLRPELIIRNSTDATLSMKWSLYHQFAVDGWNYPPNGHVQEGSEPTKVSIM